MTAAARGDGRLPLVVIGGFLGAGKSSWLRHQLHLGRFGAAHVLVNEAAETPVDNLLLGRAHSLEVLAGGCACCEGRDALIAALRAAVNAADAAPGSLGSLVLETSGLADPAAIAAAIAADPVLVRRLALAETVVMVDARHAAAQLAAEPLARRQIAAADRLVLTKTGAADPDATARLIATLRQLGPGATLEAAELGEPVPLPDAAGAAPLPLPPLPDEVEPLRPHRLAVAQEGGWVVLTAWLSALLHAHGQRIVRVKGVVRSPAGPLLLQSVQNVVQPPELLPAAGLGGDGGDGGPAPEPDMIVLIGRGIPAEALAASWRRYGLGEGG